ncbi:Ulp1 protease family protein [Sphaerosporella brunnea]|uniref:Ulp1 protease family protein n=1 Tax=Sphaerosporella brunnea TaxID=1250544 RepID=A0A5J5F0D8_9PEZI|nr:Ulp1 protease family protein [Sphaerosporella brunnea]
MSAQPSPGALFLSYGEVRVVYQDYQSLAPGQWLTDTVLEFWETYLEFEELSKHPASRVLFIRPALVAMIRHVDQAKDAIMPLLEDCHDATHLFIPVNDGGSTTSGSHWSLLVLSMNDRVAFHYDSVCNYHHSTAVTIIQNLGSVLGLDLKLVEMKNTPQQDNTWDCGVYVLWAMKHLLVRRLLAVDRDKLVDMCLRGKRLNPEKMRTEVIAVMDALRKQACRRASPQ